MARRPHLTTFSASLRAAEAIPFDAQARAASHAGHGEVVPLPPRRRAPAGAKAAVFIRVTPDSLTALHDLAAAEGVTVQDLGVYALNLAMAKFGREPVVESATER